METPHRTLNIHSGTGRGKCKVCGQMIPKKEEYLLLGWYPGFYGRSTEIRMCQTCTSAIQHSKWKPTQNS